MKRLPLLFGLMLLLAACEKDIEFNGEVTEPMMVINAIIPQDSLLEIKITESRFFMQHEDTFKTVKNATVDVYVNGVFSETMTNAGNGHYTSHVRVSEGDRIRIVSEAPSLKTVSAEMQIVSPAEVIKLDTTITITSSWPLISYDYEDGTFGDTIGWDHMCTINCKLTFKDAPNTFNFYRLVLYNKQSFDSIYYYTNNIWFERTDVVFGESTQTDNDIIDNGTYNMYGTFTDELFEGKNYPLTFSIEVMFRHFLDENRKYGFDPLRMTDYYIDLQTLSKSYYLYLVTSSNYNEDDLFAEPVQIHSNIIGGAGILGNYSHNVVKLNLPH